jgi:hypothetical protein
MKTGEISLTFVLLSFIMLSPMWIMCLLVQITWIGYKKRGRLKDVSTGSIVKYPKRIENQIESWAINIQDK